MYGTKFIRIDRLNYSDFEKIWCDEFMKILKFNSCDMKKVRDKDSVNERLNTFYKSTKASVLYAFYLSILIDGYAKVRDYTSKSTFYRKVKDLKDVGVDISQSNSIIIKQTEIIDFDPFVDLEREVV